jgi:hypothetical protein
MGLLLLGVLLMPSVCGYTWSGELDAIVQEEAVRAGVPLDLAYTYIAAESGFNPDAVTPEAPGGYSYGLLQLYDRGQGAGYPVDVLLDPRSNLQIGLPYIAAAFQATWSPTIAPYEFIWLVSIRSGHPGDVPRNDSRIVRIATIWNCFFPAAGISGPGGAPSTAAAPGPAAALAGGMAALLAPGSPVPPASFATSTHFGSVPAVVVVAARILGRQMVWRLGPRTFARRQLSALSPAGLKRRFIRAIDPREQLTRAFRLPYGLSAIRLPRNHRFPRW